MKLKLIITIFVLYSSITFMQTEYFGSRTLSKETKNIQVVQKIFSPTGTIVYVDSLNGANDTTALKSRGYLLYWRGTGDRGLTFWFQGNSSVFPAFDGPPNGYLGANFNSVQGNNTIDDWLVLPKLPGGIKAGDSLYFYSRSPLGSIFADSIRVMYSVNDSVPEGIWVELGRFETITDGTWELRGFAAPTTSLNGRFAIRYRVANGGPSGTNSNYIGIDAISIVRSIVIPEYYNSNSGTYKNNFPFTVSGGKAVNNLIRAGELNQPTSLPSGYQISKVYFRPSTTGKRYFTNLQFLVTQDDITNLTSGAFYSGHYDTVLYHNYDSLDFEDGLWTGIQLDRPYPYDPSKSLIYFLGQCGSSGAGGQLYYNSGGGIRRVWSVAGCPFTPYASGDAVVYDFGVDVIPIGDYTPDLLYYKFEENIGGTIVNNCANPGVGNNPATFTNMVIDTNGQFDSCLVGTGLNSSGVATGWNCDLGTSSWTISMWIQIPSSSSGQAYYLFGDYGSNSFRCFHNGSAGQDNLMLRGTGITEVLVKGIGPAPTIVTFVYDSVASEISAFKNGILDTIVAQAPLNLPVGSGFKVGSYSTSYSMIGKMDEFRLYRRALTDEEVWASVYQNMACGSTTGIEEDKKNIIPTNYSLNQNYPNPFNPSTKISYSIPKQGHVNLIVYDILGQKVATLVDEVQSTGNYIIEFNASNLASGIYFYRLSTNDYTNVKKMILIK